MPENAVSTTTLARPSTPKTHVSLDADIIIKNAPDPVFVSDLEGKILSANDAVYELLGFRTDEARVYRRPARGDRARCHAQCAPQSPQRFRRGDLYDPQRLRPARCGRQSYWCDWYPARHARTGQGPRLCRQLDQECARPGFCLRFRGQDSLRQ